MRLTASCEIMVRNVGRAGGYVAVEITQGKADGEEVTTLLLCRDRARELASVLLRHSGDARDGVQVGGEPPREPNHLKYKEGHAAHERDEEVADLLAQRAAV